MQHVLLRHGGNIRANDVLPLVMFTPNDKSEETGRGEISKNARTQIGQIDSRVLLCTGIMSQSFRHFHFFQTNADKEHAGGKTIIIVMNIFLLIRVVNF